VRFFGGWSFEPVDAQRPDVAATGYRKGVQKAGDLTAEPAERAPTFLVRATRDPLGANLDRVQIVKGWRRGNGELLGRVYEGAASDGRQPDARGRGRQLV
jgi:hypothetical protein